MRLRAGGLADPTACRRRAVDLEEGQMRPWTRILVLAVASMLVVACTSGGSSQTPSPTVGASGPTSSAAPSGSAPTTSEACNPPRQEGVTLTFVSFGGAYQDAQRKAWLEPYTALTGVAFQEDNTSLNATIKAQVEAGQVTWDVVDVGNDFGLEANSALLEELDYSLIPEAEVNKDLGPSKWRVPDITYGVVLAYNTEKTAGQIPAGWADYFDTTKFPGARGMWDYSEGGIFEVALMADGVAPADLYTTGPGGVGLDLERATKKLDTIKDDIVWWTSGADSQRLIGTGEVAMTLIWNGRGWSAKHTDNKPVEMQWNEQIVTADYLVVPKGSPNKDAAMKFIAYTICAENNAKPSDYIPYGPTNINAKPAPDKVADLSVSNAENAAYFDDEWLVNNYDTVNKAYKDWKSR
jgi:putative spermidine/putrescine transport system substrate-binding protein